ncbi:helix-hairpin-helix domain-containing protein [Epilithonimonas sp. JDS]|uniref:helix-hairpin-helix domain-containing protein n=1 Tax=Epilithonimonas sp. JDS TaxID=2902797 RepID=UPI001E4A39F5|nr:helix-hairpin-helix domain-containing protein [Epilithonimonas sp. JDS]MCD9853228.1 helix-hairpin-helix domain-containing protein [Epilithonimonas sp. JDS]
MNQKLPFQIRKRQLLSLAIFGILIIFSQVVFTYYKKNQHYEKLIITFVSESDSKSKSEIILTEFDPNQLDENQWKNLGFSEKQVKTILKYKEVVGGNFSSKAQFKKCYAVSPDKYEELKNYILLPETKAEAKNQNFNYKTFEKKKLNIRGKFNPDLYSQKDWENLGFSEKQASAILKYKNYLGGSFISKEKLKECFIINDEQFSQMSPYLILQTKTPETLANKFEKKREKESVKINQYFDPNTLNTEQWQTLGFSEKQANVIVNYRDRNLRGSFKSLEDIQKCFVISAEKFEEMKPWIRLSVPEKAKPTEEKTIVSEQTDFSKINLNQITFKQLQEFGFTEKDAAGILAFRKKLGGFINKNQLLETYEIDRAMGERLIYSAKLDNSNVAKYTLANAPEDWLKKHPYFRYSADRIIYYRITNPDDKKIWKFLKLKPEYEEKMRLYIINDK